MNIHQTLHGYDDGHKLLSASRNLPTSTKRQLLLLSDMSGPSMIKGFEKYLTGYPLPEIGAYAFAMTWYAGEMKRPGCVWTHTLIVDFTDLDDLRDLAVLVPMFQRPKHTVTGFQTTQPLNATRNEVSDYIPERFDAAMTQAVLQALYELPELAIVVPAETSSAHEDLAVSIWSQQWPRLRRNFAFCTGAFAPRLLGECPFDLQIVPTSSSRLFVREPDKYRIIPQQRQESNPTRKMWTIRVAHDIRTPTLRSLGPVREGTRGFLWEYSEDVNANRSSFGFLAQTYEDLLEFHRNFSSSLDSFSPHDPIPDVTLAPHSRGRVSSLETSIERLISQVSERFPNPKEAILLKYGLFGDKKLLPKQVQDVLLERLILYSFAMTDAYSAYDSSVLGIRQRSSSWANSNIRDAGSMISLLLRSHISPLGEDVLVGALEGLEAESALELATKDPTLLPVFISTHPGLAEVPQVWRGSVNQQQELLDVLMQNGDTVWNSVVVAVLEAGVDGIAQDLVYHADKDVVSTALNWLNSDNESSDQKKLSQEWQRVLRTKPSILIDWLCAVPDARITVLAFVANLLDPHSPDVQRLTASVWLRLAENGSKVLSQEPLIKSAVFLLSIAFHNTDQASSKLMACVFPIVYHAAGKDQVPQSSWRLISHQVPSFHGVKDWDKCERLLQAVANNARVFRWPVADLLKATQDEQLFKRVLEYCKEFPEGKQYLIQIRNEVSTNASIATEHQLRTLSQKSLWKRMMAF